MNGRAKHLGYIEYKRPGATQNNAKNLSTLPFPRDPRFVGREDILARLDSIYEQPLTHGRAALHGLGGIGYIGTQKDPIS